MGKYGKSLFPYGCNFCNVPECCTYVCAYIATYTHASFACVYVLAVWFICLYYESLDITYRDTFSYNCTCVAMS